jgi:branched-chain amino acid transport system substrate-binding protein
MLGSEAATCATKLVYDESIHYVVGPIGTTEAVAPIMTQGKTFYSVISTPKKNSGPQFPYALFGPAPECTWVSTFWEQAYQAHPEIKTVGILADTSSSGEGYLPCAQVAHASHGTEMIHVGRYQRLSTEYYPVLTPMVAKNPDAISMEGSSAGDIDLIVKQARELGYKGLLISDTRGETSKTVEIAGLRATEGFITNAPDYSSALYSESVRKLYAEFQQRYPGMPLPVTTYLAYGSVWLYVQAIEKASSIDPDMVVKVFDDPNFEFEFFGTQTKLGGFETYGIRRCVQTEVCYAEVINGVSVMKSHKSVVVP